MRNIFDFYANKFLGKTKEAFSVAILMKISEARPDECVCIDSSVIYGEDWQISQRPPNGGLRQAQ
ncbi:MAG TPA: hypothetical protein DER33_04470 [Syntrophomonas sp.]|nr:hypothetical protein [Syntrophomonas sp.]